MKQTKQKEQEPEEIAQQPTCVNLDCASMKLQILNITSYPKLKESNVLIVCNACGQLQSLILKGTTENNMTQSIKSIPSYTG